MRAIRIAAVVLVAVAVAAGLALAFGIPVGFLADTVQKRFKAETGHRLVISGSAWLMLRPSLRLQIDNVALIDESDRAEERRLSVESVRIDAAASSLWSGQPRLTEITIVRPVFFAPMIRQRAARTSTAPPRDDAGRPGAAADVVVGRVVIQEGTIVFADQRKAVESRLEHINATVVMSKPDDAVELRGTARAGTHTLGLSVKTKIPGGRLDGRTVPLEFSLEAPSLLQDTVPGVAELRSRGSSIAINGLSGTIGQSKFSGQLSADLTSKPMLRMDLNFQRLDIAVAQPAGGSSASSAAPPSFEQPWSDQEHDLAGLNFVDAEMQVTVGDLRVGRLQFAPITFAAILSDGVLRAAVTRTAGYGGQLQGTLTTDVSGAEPSHALRVDVVGVRALQFLSAVADFPYLDGRMVARVDARGRGRNTRAVMSTLNGAIDLRFEDGEIRNVNVAKMIRTLAASILNGWNENRAEKTDLSQLSAFFRIENGRATTDNLRLVGPLIRVSGAGTADIGAKTLQFRLDPRLVMTTEGQGSAANPVGLGVPVVVQGSWGAPRIYPEVAGILDNPQGAFDRLKEMGSGLFGQTPGQAGGAGGSLLQGLDSLISPRDRPPPARR